ncbi:MAG: 50S ribosomal protein L23 [Flavobacteriales bacterium]|mgnify:CR=1 FL=1|nr:50S ribosomal protein L23 [Flavobacteriales bacterium]HCA82756.1 50S ribosomal protein L23 [Flavobacteriales bacterium]HRE73232.1 50S ribosomal protein L23 [Flavobacteriales bacterium]HRE98740.1 50S ribosomal protein L23 [Flavobacteriales bacterium]HRJ38439.1 50S ribosomal protein L23 [Flavobacteriales bacterium]
MSILIKPIITEKVTAQNEKGRYGFIVARGANKVEIKKAVEKHFNVTVKSVNTITLGGGKEKTKYTNKGVSKASQPVIKKAFVTLAEGDVIDLYGNI